MPHCLWVTFSSLTLMLQSSVHFLLESHRFLFPALFDSHFPVFHSFRNVTATSPPPLSTPGAGHFLLQLPSLLLPIFSAHSHFDLQSMFSTTWLLLTALPLSPSTLPLVPLILLDHCGWPISFQAATNSKTHLCLNNSL